MAAMHHVSIAPEDAGTWTAMLDAVADGDIVVLLDQAARALQQDPGAIDWPRLRERGRGVRWLLPALELLEPSPALPAGIEVVDSAQWLDLIAGHAALLDWS